MSDDGDPRPTAAVRPGAQVRTGAELYELVAGVAARYPAPGVRPPADQAGLAHWSGLLVRVGDWCFLAHLDQIAAVLEVPPDLTPVPGTGNRVRGIANHQGTLLPILDLAALIGGGPAARCDTERVLVVHQDGPPCGLAVTAVLGLRHCDHEARRAPPPGGPGVLRPFIDEAIDLAGEVVPVLALDLLSAAPPMGLG